MTFAYATFTLGFLFLYSAFTGKSIPDILTGTGGPGTVSTEPTLGDSPGGSSSNGTGKASSIALTGGKPVNIDGHPVCGSIAKIIKQAEADGVHVTVLSGIRTKAESIAACQKICGAPTCAGTCAGASSNHNGCSPGAVDIGSGCEEFRAWLAKHGNPIKNDLPADTCHFSATGH